MSMLAVSGKPQPNNPTHGLLLGAPEPGTVVCLFCEQQGLERLADHSVWTFHEGETLSISLHVHRPVIQ